MRYVSQWERLPAVLARVMETGGLTREEAQADICVAIADGRIKIRGKLDKHAMKPLTATEVLEGRYLLVSTDLKPEDFNWEESRPVKPWVVTPEGSRVPGPWHLEWIKLSRFDVTDALCGVGRQAERAPALPSHYNARATSRNRPAFQRAQRAIAELYPQGVPTQTDLPNPILCRRVGDHLRSQGLPNVSDDTILRAAGRRK
jgi:hypothetical protein